MVQAILSVNKIRLRNMFSWKIFLTLRPSPPSPTPIEKGLAPPLAKRREQRADADVNEGKFYIFKYWCIVCFMIALKTNRCVWWKNNFSVYFYGYPFLLLLQILNKEESKVICMREFETILFQTQSLLIKGSLVLRTF
jgi:hypothetical protein